ncbi:hypothetical protein I3843_03G012000 [Carya illinoinensis]|uniref:Uncharacterized protein n=1 Tax=Carya illinoinensis TaxID=32201 RepID=A0A8T1QVP2_CARIL|nr:uncharacterized protein LOC122302331 [Carya illinoinensis]KAG2714021.1 hypothetical protein I3760_03G006800 [Carya illinoinensis]KAG6659150.1 hypothetical protein CIPAW_03G012800 [Carya illinoinensis]KAG7985178.1 hypothetical protein I3843_03G012000 [Carya illinoinensis]
MDEYLQYMKTLRSQMNDVEDQAAKISVEEQMQLTTIQTMENDLNSAKSETKKLKEDTEQMRKEKGQICSQILEKQRRIASLESDSSTLTQTLDLIQQEKASFSAKLIEKSIYYTKVAEDINCKLQEQQDWVNSHDISRELGEHGLVKTRVDEQTGGKSGINSDLIMDNLGNEAKMSLAVKLDSAKANLNAISEMKSNLVMENSKMMQLLEQVRCRANEFKPELRAMDIKTLEEEHRALLSDKAGETEYLQSLLDQIGKLKGISHVVKCACGEEYEVGVDSHG